MSQNTLPKRIPLPPSPIETESLSTLSPGKISISLSPEKDKDSTISDEAKKETVKLEVSDENITGQKFKRPMMLLMVKLVDLWLHLFKRSQMRQRLRML